MRIFIFLIALGLNSKLSSQAVDESWFFSVDTKAIIGIDYQPSMSDPGEVGVDQIWDYENQLIRQPIYDSISYVVPEQTRFGSAVSGSNLCKVVKNNFFLTEYYYLQNQEEIKSLGFSFETSEEPIIYGRQIMNNGFALGDTIWTNDDEFEYYHFDAIGTVITPVDTYESCIRLHHVNLDNGLDEYIWYQGSLMKEVLSVFPVKFDSLFGGDFGYVRYLEDYSSSTTSLDLVLEDFNFNVIYQQGILHLDNLEEPKTFDLQLYDLNGRILFRQEVDLSSGKNKIDLPINEGISTSYVMLLLQEMGSPRFWSQKVLIVER